VCVPLESVVGAGEDVDDGGDGLGGGGGGVGGERCEGGMGEREKSGKVFGVFFFVGNEIRQESRIGRTVDHVRRAVMVGGRGGKCSTPCTPMFTQIILPALTDLPAYHAGPKYRRQNTE